MSLKRFPILADENIDSEIIGFLRKNGFDVFSIVEEGLFGISDLQILTQSFVEGKIVLTQDSDFGTLIFRNNIKFIGIVFLRPGHFSPEFHISTLKTILLEDIELVPPFILVAENTGKTVRLRLRNFNL